MWSCDVVQQPLNKPLIIISAVTSTAAVDAEVLPVDSGKTTRSCCCLHFCSSTKSIGHVGIETGFL